jgi:uncharacterized membrane protein YhaH (DUF805 family)
MGSATIAAGSITTMKPLLATVALCFSGRINRAKYWLGFFGVQLYFVLALSIVQSNTEGTIRAGTVAGTALGCLVLIGAIALYAITIKRLHDINLSGWWFLALIPLSVVPGTLLVLGSIRGTKGPNRFGPDPLAYRRAATS